MSDELDALEQEKTAIVKLLNNKDLNTADDVKSAIKKLNYKMNTTTMNNTDSNKTIKEIANLEANIEKAERLSEIKPKINELYQSKNTHYAELKVQKAEVLKRDGEIEILRKQMETINEGKSDTNKQVDAINEKITKVQTDISALYAKKDELREIHFKNRYDYEVQRDLINHITWLKDKKENILNREVEKVQLAEQRK